MNIKLFTHTDLDGIGCARAAGSQLEEKIIYRIIYNIFPEITKNKD